MHLRARLCLLLPLLLTPTAFAQTTPDAPPQANTPQDAPLNPKLPTVFIVGDSTARNGANLGWGDHFAALFDTTRINVANRARAGRSSRTYINEGLWDHVLSELKPGDFVLIQMGHNDGASTAATIGNDPKARGSIKGIGNETVDLPIKTPYATGPLAGKTTETVHTYGWYLRKYISEARAKGATPILLTVTIRNIWIGDPGTKPHIERDMGFRDYEYQIAASEHVAIADMATREADFFDQLGPTETARFFPVDHTHTSALGATYAALAVADALRQIKLPFMAFTSGQIATGEILKATAEDGSEEANHSRFLVDRPQMELFAKALILKMASLNPSGDPGQIGLTKLPPGITQITEHDQVVTWPNGRPTFVLFITFSGILNSFAGYAYSESGDAPPKDAFTGYGFQVVEVAPHWFWYSSRN